MIVDIDKYGVFQLDEEFLQAYVARPVRWGFGPLSWATYKRTYSRDGESWWQTCRRVIEGMFSVQRAHCMRAGLAWDSARALHEAHEAYERLWAFKWTPPGRGLWIMGTPFVYERGGAALNNCGFVSTKDLATDFSGPFLWMLQMSMLGVGVGFDTRGRGKLAIVAARVAQDVHIIGDSREGWAGALGRLLNAYVGKGSLPAGWDFSQIRPHGSALRSFGGFASGPGPLSRMLADLQTLLGSYAGRRVDSRLIVDAMNLIGRCVVAGGIRRSAQIAFGEADDEEFMDLKQDRNKVLEYRWASNNSIFASAGMDYSAAVRRTVATGEPGYMWLENARAYGRMGDEPNWLDAAAEGSNPCVEQTLWDRELCCLVETFPAHHESFEDYQRTLAVAYRYAKAVTLVETEDAATNAVMLRNRRLGCSMTGVVQAIDKFGYGEFFRWCDRAYAFLRRLDEEHSAALAVPRSIKLTSVKPSGTVSLLAGATPGVHWEHAPYYIRRVRVTMGHPLVEMCRRSGYHVEDDVYSQNTVVVSFPVHVERLGRCKSDVPLLEKVDLAAQMQRFWSDNQVSITAEFDPDREGGQLPGLLHDYENRLKAVVFLPSRGHGYQQPPYEQITRSQYERIAGGLRPLRGDLDHEQELEARFCDGDLCEMP
ncbi:MAG: fused protease/ribonucleoside-triphosphate reductase [Phycisphaerae bacterium]